MDIETVQRRKMVRSLLWMVLTVSLLSVLGIEIIEAQSTEPGAAPEATRTATATVADTSITATITRTMTATTTATTPETPMWRYLVRYNATLRAGPGGTYPIVERLGAGETITTVATSDNGAWLQLANGAWIPRVMVKATEAIPTPTSTGPVPPPRRLIATAAPTATATPALSVTMTATATVSQSAALSQTVTLTAAVLPRATRARVTPTRQVLAVALRNANLRAGPGTNYAVVGGVVAEESLTVQGSNPDGTWYRLRDGSWIAAFLVAYEGRALPTVAPTVIAAIPTAAPTATPSPTPTSQAPSSTVANTPEETAVPDAPAPDTAATASPSSGNSTFVVVERRLWNPWENGGSTDGPSVHCGQGRNLVVNVLDEFGGRLNNVAVQAEYGAKEIHVTGAQGKGDGVVEFVLGGGQDIRVIRDADGSPVEGEYARGLSTDPRGIDQSSLQQAGYCQDDESCRTFANNLSCIGHFSWTVTFQRRR